MKYFETTTTSLATFLTYQEHELHEVRPLDGTRVVLISFVRTPGLDADVMAFGGNEARVEPRQYANEHFLMRKRIFRAVEEAHAA